MQKGLLLIFGLLIFGWQWGIGGNECELEVLEDIETVDDFGSVISGETLNIDVLANDQGDGLRLTQIITPPQCGEILEWSEYGEVVSLVWKGTMQNNRLETLDLGNVGRGLYVLQVVMEEEVLVERFWVE